MPKISQKKNNPSTKDLDDDLNHLQNKDKNLVKQENKHDSDPYDKVKITTEKDKKSSKTTTKEKFFIILMKV